jgi:hypothetical protein
MMPLELAYPFGKPRITVPRNLSLLATSGVLRYESPGGRTTGLVHVGIQRDPSQHWHVSIMGQRIPKMGL